MFDSSDQVAVEPPLIPMPWIWSCHKCHTRYLLGATRRCLNDGHYFCGGVTVERFTGRVKKHRACVSEFDYTGWEEFSEWKRATSGPIPRLGSGHCEDECKFPSSCHWNKQHAAHNMEPIVHKGSESYVDEAEREAERQKRILSTIEDQKSLSSDATPKLNGLDLHNPVMDFSRSEKGAGEGDEIVDKAQMKLTMPKSQANVAQSDDIGEEMRDWIAEDDSVGRAITPCALTETEGMEAPFDFRFEGDDGATGAIAFLADDVSPLWSMYDHTTTTSNTNTSTTTWKWTADEIGLALSPPGQPREGEM